MLFALLLVDIGIKWVGIKVTVTCSWTKLVCHKLICITFLTKSYRIFTTTSRYRGHLAIVQHNTNFATVHSQVTVGGCSVEYECKLLCQYTTTVGATEPEQLNVSLLTLLHTECRIPLFYLLVGHRFRVTQRAFKKNFFFVHYVIVGLQSCWVPILWVSSSLSATAALLLIRAKTLSVALQWQFVLVLHQAPAYCHSTAYLAKLVLRWTIAECLL